MSRCMRSGGISSEGGDRAGDVLIDADRGGLAFKPAAVQHSDDGPSHLDQAPRAGTAALTPLPSGRRPPLA